MKKHILIPVAVIALAGATLLGGAALANESTDQETSMVQLLAKKLGIEETKVQTAFDQIRDEKQKERETARTTKLDQAVKDGKLTEAQKNLILKKHGEMQAERENERAAMQNLTPEERRAKMQSRRTEMEAWAKANGISTEYFMGPQGDRGGMGMRFSNK